MGNVVTVEVIAEVKKMTQGIDQVNKSMGSMEKVAKSGSGVLKGALAADLISSGVSAITNGLGEAWGAVKEQDKLAAQTAATLKSTGGAANVSADQIAALSDGLEKKSLIDAEAIQSGANLMLTFTGVKNAAGEGNDVFDQSIQTMADMSTALGKDTAGSATMLGKALNDPIKGISALSKVGVSFTDQQKAQIQSMVKAGDTVGAQKVILAELNKEYGGSAAASAEADGGMKRLKDTLDGVLEEGIKAVMPYVQQLATWLADNLPGAIDQAKAALAPMQPLLDGIGGALAGAFQWMADNPETVQAFATALGVMAGVIGIVTAVQWLWNVAAAANPLGLIVLAIAAVVAGIVWLITNIDTVTAVIGEAWGNIAKWTEDTWNGFSGAISGAWNAAVTWVTDGVNGIGKWISDGWNGLTKSTVDAWNGFVSTVSNGITGAVNWVAGLPGRTLAALGSLAGKLGSAAGAAWDRFKSMTVSTALGAIDWVKGIPGRILTAIGNVANLLKDAGKGIMDGFLGGLTDGWNKVTGFVGGIADWIVNNKGPLPYDRVLLKPAGRAIMAGLVGGLRAGVPALTSELAGVTRQIEGGVSPSLAGAGRLTLGGNGSAAAGTTVVNVTVESSPLASPVDVGRAVVEAIREYVNAGGRVVFN